MADIDDKEMVDAPPTDTPAFPSEENDKKVADTNQLDVPASHPAIFARMKSTRRKNQPTPRTKVQSIFRASIDGPSHSGKEEESNEPPSFDPRFAVETPFLPPTETFSAIPLRTAQPSSTNPPNPPPVNSSSSARTSSGYSNEARAYHARHAALLEEHESQCYYQVEQGCLAMLLEPRMPLFTRVQILQLLATVWSPSGAERCLQEAQELLDAMDRSEEVRLLKHDNARMVADLNTWRTKNGISGDLQEALADQPEEAFSSDQAPAASYWDFDRDIQASLDEEVEDGLAHVGYKVDGKDSAETEKKRTEEKKRAEDLYD